MKQLLILVFLWLCAACTSGADDITGKWQMRTVELPGGEQQQVDNLFYNFQKGSFSVICVLKVGVYETFFGNYSLKDGEISIILLPESVKSENYDTFVGWTEGRQTFQITELSSNRLCLKSGGKLYTFRRY